MTCSCATWPSGSWIAWAPAAGCRRMPSASVTIRTGSPKHAAARWRSGSRCLPRAKSRPARTAAAGRLRRTGRTMMDQGSRPPDSLSPADYYRILRGQIEHEDNLISQRLSWFIMSQSFLFTAYAIVVANFLQRSPPGLAAGQRLSLLVLIPVVAICTSILILITIVPGVIAMHHVRRLFRGRLDRLPDPDLPPVQGLRRTQVLGLAAPLLLPCLFTAVWLFLLVSGFA